MNLREEVEHEIEQRQLCEKGDSIIVAVSGGPDSVALLHVLSILSPKWEWKLTVAHVNHQFRVKESALEAEYVRQLAARLHLPCEIAVIDVPAYMNSHAMNAQLAARVKRFQFLHRIAKQYGARKIALAHHADDQAETILMRLIRGTGSEGLSGIPWRRGENQVELIRPFLNLHKTQLMEYCQQEALAPCLDNSNLQRKYFRNQLRLDVMPYLQQYNPQFPAALNRLADVMTAENDYIEGITKQIFDKNVTVEGNRRSFQREFYLALPIALQRRLIKLILSCLSSGVESLGYHQVELLRSAIRQQETPSLSLDVNVSLRFVREYERISFIKTAKDRDREADISADFRYVVSPEKDRIYIEEIGVVFKFTKLSRKEYEERRRQPLDDTLFVAFDFEKLTFPLIVRNREKGDRIQVMGLNGSKKIKDIFIDAKIPPSRRNFIPIVAYSTGEIIWIAGVRRSIHALLTGETKQIYLLEWAEGCYDL